MMIRNEFRELSSIDNVQLKIGERWSFVDTVDNSYSQDFLSYLQSNGSLLAVVFNPLKTLRQPYTWFLMDVMSDFLFVGVYTATLFQIVEEGRDIGPSRDSMPVNFIFCMVLVFGLLLMEVCDCTAVLFFYVVGCSIVSKCV